MEKPKLELPQRVAVARPVFDRRTVVLLLLGSTALAVLIALQLRGPRVLAPGGPADARAALSPAQLEQLALRLEDKNLAGAAAAAWQDHLAAAALPPEKAARIHARVGRLLQDAGRYEDALAQYYRAELLAGANRAAVGDDLALRISDCFQRMGRYGELAREVAERTSIHPAADGLSGRQIVAEIGDEQITAADFERLLREEVENMIAASPGMSAAQGEQIRKQVHERFARPEQRAQMLQQIVARRVLAREARDRKLDQDPAYRRRLVHDADALLAATLTSRITEERATTTPDDVRRFYDAGKARYATPARGDIARIVCAKQDEAARIIELLDGGADFAKLAKEHSTDERTRGDGGRLGDPLDESGDGVPGVGADAKLHAMLWGLKSGEHLKEPYPVDDTWHVYRMIEKRDARTPPFEEVRERVESDCAAARRTEVLQQFVGEIFEKHRVRLNPSAATTRPSGDRP